MEITQGTLLADDDKDLYNDFYVDPEKVGARYAANWSLFGNTAIDLNRLIRNSRSYGLQDSTSSPCIRQQTYSTNKVSGCNFLIAGYIAQIIFSEVKLEAIYNRAEKENLLRKNPTTGEVEVTNKEALDAIANSISFEAAYKDISMDWAFDRNKQFKFYTKTIHREFPHFDAGNKKTNSWSIYFGGIQSFAPAEGCEFREVWSYWDRYGNQSKKPPVNRFRETKANKEFLFNKENWKVGTVRQIVKTVNTATELSRTAYDRKVAYIAKTAILLNAQTLKLKLRENEKLTKEYNLPPIGDFGRGKYDKLVKEYGERFLNDSICKRCLKPFNFDVLCYKVKTEYDKKPLDDYFKTYVHPIKDELFKKDPEIKKLFKDDDKAFRLISARLIDPNHFLEYLKNQREYQNAKPVVTYDKTVSIREIEKLYDEHFKKPEYLKKKEPHNFTKEQEEKLEEVFDFITERFKQLPPIDGGKGKMGKTKAAKLPRRNKG